MAALEGDEVGVSVAVEIGHTESGGIQPAGDGTGRLEAPVASPEKHLPWFRVERFRENIHDSVLIEIRELQINHGGTRRFDCRGRAGVEQPELPKLDRAHVGDAVHKDRCRGGPPRSSAPSAEAVA